VKEMTIYQFEVKQMDGTMLSLEEYEGKVVLIVNTASKCGFTKQFAGLEELYSSNKEQGFVILGFPCNKFLGQELGTDAETLGFCQKNYGVTFPMFSKIKVRGKDKSPLFEYLISESDNKKIEWNFTKFLINREGKVVDRFSPKTTPESIEKSILDLLSHS
jgi:glutathione peroxidase